MQSKRSLLMQYPSWPFVFVQGCRRNSRESPAAFLKKGKLVAMNFFIGYMPSALAAMESSRPFRGQLPENIIGQPQGSGVSCAALSGPLLLYTLACTVTERRLPTLLCSLSLFFPSKADGSPAIKALDLHVLSRKILNSADDPSKYIPWSWAITPLEPNAYPCPSTHRILLTYLAAKLVTSVLGFAFGHRGPLNFLTCCICGTRNSYSWTYMWILQLTLHFGADLVVAALVINSTSPAYNSALMPQVWDLALFYASRPRMAWMFLGGLGLSNYWSSAAMQTIIAELIMTALIRVLVSGTHGAVRAAAGVV